MSEYGGSVDSRFAVDADGGASYAIPIKVPPGTAGMEPNLTLSYNSAAGNGMLGMGWSLGGLSAISRSSQTLAQDGANVPVNYSAGDRFSMDGQRLMVVNGVDYSSPDAVYHTQIESWSKVVPVTSGVAGRSGPDSFLVYTKDGRTMEYGGTPDSQIAASPDNPSIRVWALNQVTDLLGNNLTITYSPDPQNSMAYPLSIDYTNNEGEGLQAQRSVQFKYEPRTPGPDAVPRFQGGYPTLTANLMTRVQTYLDGSLIRTYTFAYETGTATSRSRMVSVTESDSQGKSLPPTTFSWQDGDQGIFAATSAPGSTGAAWKGSMIAMDVNGDGLVDLVNAYQSGNYLQLSLMLSNGQGFADPVVLPVTDIPYSSGSGVQLLPMDVNGDGCTDLVVASPTGGGSYLGLTVLTAQTDGNGGWELAQGTLYGAGPAQLPHGGQLTAMDVDGDGLCDLVYAYESGQSLALAVLFSDGTTFAKSGTDQTNPEIDYYAHPQFVGLDFNGDGMSDLVYAYQSGQQLAMTLFLSAGRNGLIQQPQSPLPPSPTLAYTGALMSIDVNADGLGDLVLAYLSGGSLAIQTLVSNGISFQPPVEQTVTVSGLGTQTPAIFPMDVNGDGLPDLVMALQGSEETLLVLLGTGSGFTQQVGVVQPSQVPLNDTLLPLDYTGDGKTDLVFAYEDFVANEYQLSLSSMPAAGEYPDLLSSALNGLGGTYSVTYTPLTDPAVYTENPAPPASTVGVSGLLNNSVTGAIYPVTGGQLSSPTSPGSVPTSRRVMFPKYVVASYLKDDGRGSTYSYSYAYTSALMDLTGYGWLGFEEVELTDPQVQTVSTTVYNQQFPLTSQPVTVSLARSTDGALMKQSTYAYGAAENPPNTGPGVQVVTTQTVTSASYTFGTLDCTQVQAFTYDQFANPVQTAMTGDACGAPVYLFQSYSNDPDRWLIGFMTGKKTAADPAGEQVLRGASLQYNTNMTVASKSQWNDQSQQMLVTVLGYDGFGNQTSSTDPSGATESSTYDPTYHTFVVTRTSPPTPSNVQLTWQSTWYPQFGLRETTTDPNGVTHTRLVDGLGRLNGIEGPDPSGNTVTLLTLSNGQDSTGVYVQLQTLADWDGTQHWARHYPDGFGRVYLTASLGPDGETPLLVQKTFDSINLVLTQSLPYYEGDTPLQIVRTYDNYRRVVSVTEPVGDGTTLTAYDYPQTYQTIQTQASGEADARVTTMEFMSFNSNLLKVAQTDALGATTSFSYDPVGRPTSVVDPIGVATKTSYDTLGRGISFTVESSESVQTQVAFDYDDPQRTVTQTDGMGTVTTQVYDALGRLSTRTITPKNGETIVVSYTLDDPSAGFALGRVSSVSDTAGPSYAYSYDARGNQVGIVVSSGPESLKFVKTMTPDRHTETITFPDGSVQTNQYNAGRSLVGITLNSPSSTQELTQIATFGQFNSAGSPQQCIYGDGNTILNSYDPTGRLLSAQVTNPGGSVLAATAFGWNNLSQVLSTTDNTDASWSQSFTYDPVGRLLDASSGIYGEQAYAYDSGGNLVLKDQVTYTGEGYQVTLGVDAAQNTVFSAQYDANGNMTSADRNGTTTTYVYDPRNWLLGADSPTMSYDYIGRRVSKQIGNGATIYSPAPYYEMAAGPDGSGQHSILVYGDRGLIATLTSVDGSSAVTGPGVPAPGLFYTYLNQVNTIQMQTDDAGEVQLTLAYEPFGEMVSAADAQTVPRTFTGKEYDADLGLYYFGGRFYDPVLGRFLTADDRPGSGIGSRDALHRYAYVLNDPVKNFDPNGHSVLDDVGHFFTHSAQSVGHFFTGDVKHFFTSDIPAFFENQVVDQIISYTEDGLLIVGGIAVTVLGSTGPWAPLFAAVGAGMLGAGISGLTYNIKTDAHGSQFSWSAWGIKEGIGGATGLIAGGASAGAGALVDSVAGDATVAAETRAQYAVGGAKRFAINVTAAAVGNSVSSAGGQLLDNLAEGNPLGQGVALAASFGALFGAVAQSASESLASGFSRVPTMENATSDQLKMRYSDWLSATNRDIMPVRWPTSAHPFQVVLDSNISNSFITLTAGLQWTAVYAASSAIDPHW